MKIYFHVLPFIALITACCAIESRADGVYLGGWSKHTNQYAWTRHGYTLNQNHGLVMIEHKGWEVGHYTNTHFGSTYMAGRYVELYSVDDIQLGVHLGATYGYTHCREPSPEDSQKKICPAVMPEARFTRWKIQPALLMMANGVALTFKIDI